MSKINIPYAKNGVLRKLFVDFLSIVTVAVISVAGFSVAQADESDYGDGARLVVAKVGDKVITFREYNEKLGKFHKSNKMGEMISGGRHSFPEEDYREWLDELIVDKLMVIAAEEMELDQRDSFKEKLENFTLNYALNRLREDQIESKVEVDEDEVEEFYQQRREEGLARQKEAAAESDAEEIEDTSPELTPEHRYQLKMMLRAERIHEREQEYFDYVVRKARVNIDEDALIKVDPDMEDMELVVARVNGEPVNAMEVLWRMKKEGGEASAKDVLDTIILYRALDREAMRKGYEKEPEHIRDLKRFREKQLIEDFKRDVVSRSIRISPKEVEEYYNENKEKYKLPDMYHFRLIRVPTKEYAGEILDELKRGADFTYLAKTVSDDDSAKDGGDIGWLPETSFPKGLIKEAEDAKEGAYLGPYPASLGYGVFQFLGHKESGYKTIEKVGWDIDKILGRKAFEKKLEKYISLMRKRIDVEVNEDFFKN